MKKIDVSDIDIAAAMPIKKGSLVFLQDSIYEFFSETIMMKFPLGYDSSAAYIMYGLEQTISGLNTIISKGVIMSGGNLYPYSGATIPTPSGGNVFLVSFPQTQFSVNADPVLFTDGNYYDVHDIKTTLITTGASGSTVFDLSECIRITDWLSDTPSVTEIGSGSISSGTASTKYKVEGRTLHIKFRYDTFNITGNVGTFVIPIPALLNSLGFKIKNDGYITSLWFSGNLIEYQNVVVNYIANSTQFTVQKLNASFFTAGSDNTLEFNLTVELTK